MDLKVLQNILNSSIDKARKIWLSQMKSLKWNEYNEARVLYEKLYRIDDFEWEIALWVRFHSQLF